jgi:hypothetical protein
MASITATGLYTYNFSGKQIRVRQSVYGGSGSSSVTAELRLAPLPHDYAIGAPADTKASDSTSSWSVIALLKGIFGALLGTLTVSGTVTANAGTNLNTSTLAVESGGNLASIASGVGSTGSAVPSKGFFKGLLAQTALPSAATAGNLVGALADKFGRAIVRGAPRELLATASINTTGTSGTLLAAQGAGVFADMYRLVIANSSAAAVLVTVSDGTNSYSYEVPANGTVGFSGAAADATPAASANTAWTYTVASGTTTIYIHAQFVLNK